MLTASYIAAAPRAATARSLRPSHWLLAGVRPGYLGFLYLGLCRTHVGWVERRETQHVTATGSLGFGQRASTQPTLQGLLNRFPDCSTFMVESQGNDSCGNLGSRLDSGCDSRSDFRLVSRLDSRLARQ